jgi:hypothetical protein
MTPNRLSPAPAALRAALVALGLALSGGAAAIVQVSITGADFDAASGTYRATVELDPSIWVSYSSTCETITPGSTCSLEDLPDPDQGPDDPKLLFSWGTKDYVTDVRGELNSRLQVNFGSDIDFALDTITFATTDPAQELGPDYQGTPDKGKGTMVAYEVNTEILFGDQGAQPPFNDNIHQVTDQLMDIRAYTGGDTQPSKTVEGWKVAVAQDTQSGRADGLTSTTNFLNAGLTGFAEYAFEQTYFFTESGLAETTDANKEAVSLAEGDMLEFQFYEEIWDYLAITGEARQTGPDAYYGSFDIIITPSDEPESTLVLSDSLRLGDLRAGDDTAVSTGAITASNQGEAGSLLSGSFAPLSGSGTGPIVADDDPNPPDTALPFSGLRQGEEASRGYTFSAETVTFDAGDAGSMGKTFTVTQEVTSDAVDDSDQSRTIEAVAKGPILGVSQQDNPDPTDPADWAAYDGATGVGDTINLGSIEVGDDFLLSTLTLANLFGAADADLTLLTFYNVGITNLTGGFFSVDAGPVLNDTIQVGERMSLVIRFDPEDTDIGLWTARLDFLTDQNRAHDVCSGTVCAAASTISFTLQARLREAPLPGALALLGAGLLSLAATRRLRARR